MLVVAAVAIAAVLLLTGDGGGADRAVESDPEAVCQYLNTSWNVLVTSGDAMKPLLGWILGYTGTKAPSDEDVVAAERTVEKGLALLEGLSPPPSFLDSHKHLVGYLEHSACALDLVVDEISNNAPFDQDAFAKELNGAAADGRQLMETYAEACNSFLEELADLPPTAEIEELRVETESFLETVREYQQRSGR